MRSTSNNKSNFCSGFFSKFSLCISQLVWYAIVITVLSVAVYLFVGGSALFSEYNTMPIVLHRQVNDEYLHVKGSVTKQNPCDVLIVSSEGDYDNQHIVLATETVNECDKEYASAVETFFIKLPGNENTVIKLSFNDVEREIVIK